MRLLSNADVEAVLTPAVAIDALRQAYDDLAVGDAAYVPRIDLWAPTGRDDDYYQWGSMAGTCRSAGVTAVRLKSDVVSWPGGDRVDKHCVRPGQYCGLILLFRTSDGAPVGLIQDGVLQHVRVGAAAALGVDALARPDAGTLGMVGSGGMARTFLDAICEVRSLATVAVYSPTAAHRCRFAAEAADRLGVEVVAVDSPQAAVAGADLVVSATSATRPTIDPAWLAPGSHVTCVTRRELSDALVARADVVVQLGIHTLPASCQADTLERTAGGIAAYIAGSPDERARIPRSRATHEQQFPTLVDVARGRAAGRTSPDQVTLFIATGTQGLQFAAVGGRVLERAVERGIGTALPQSWFLQDIRD